MIDPTHPALDHAFSSPASLLYEGGGVEVWHADWRALSERVAGLGGCDAVIVDAPYSEKTHAGHDSAGRYDGSAVNVRGVGGSVYGASGRTRGINYPAWGADDVMAFVAAWDPLCRGWFATITDDVLAPAWRDALETAGRYVFAPIPIVEIGSRVRLVADGPSSWTCWLVVARPRSGAWLEEWRAQRRRDGKVCVLPGAYVFTGRGDRVVMGGKRTDAMRRIVEDYTHEGSLVVDPCAGGGTAALACRLLGRRCITGDVDLAHARIAAERLREVPTQPAKDGTLALFGGSSI